MDIIRWRFHEQEEKFFDFVKSRSENTVEEWAQSVKCPIIRIDGTKPVEEKVIMEKFVEAEWDLISVPAQQWLDGKYDKDVLISAIKQADKECGSCGCNLDPLYKRALELV